MNENEWDKLLKIHTTGTDNTDADQYRYPYEPTPYSVLERLGNSGWIRKENTLLDYGCGKGRVDFFLSYQTRCHSVGIEYNERIYAKAVENKETAVSAERVDFVVENAEQFPLPAEVDRIYFFNPFSLEILRKVMARIRESYYEKPRQMQLQQTGEPTEALRKKLEKNENQIQQTTAKIEEQEKQLNSYADELKAAGVNTDNLEEANGRLQSLLATLKHSWGSL